MSALRQVFVRVHSQYEQDRYAEDLERFAAWLLATRYRNKNARRHLCRVQQVLHAIGAAPGTALRADVLGRAFARLARRWTRCHTASTYAGYLRASGRLIEQTPAQDPLSSLLEEFCGRLVRRRGLASATVTEYRYSVSHFLQQMLRPGQSLEQLTPRSLESYVRSRGREVARSTLLAAVRCIKAFLLRRPPDLSSGRV